jgi:hypothetical protein
MAIETVVSPCPTPPSPHAVGSHTPRCSSSTSKVGKNPDNPRIRTCPNVVTIGDVPPMKALRTETMGVGLGLRISGLVCVWLVFITCDHYVKALNSAMDAGIGA